VSFKLSDAAKAQFRSNGCSTSCVSQKRLLCLEQASSLPAAARGHSAAARSLGLRPCRTAPIQPAMTRELRSRAITWTASHRSAASDNGLRAPPESLFKRTTDSDILAVAPNLIDQTSSRAARLELGRGHRLCPGPAMEGSTCLRHTTCSPPRLSAGRSATVSIAVLPGRSPTALVTRRPPPA